MPFDVSFFLKRPDASRSTSIILEYSCQDGRLKYYTGESIDPKLWPGKVSAGTRAILNRIEDTIKKTVESYKIIGTPLTGALLRASLDKALGRLGKGKSSDMFSDMGAVIDLMESGKILVPKSKKRYAKGTIKNFRQAVIMLQEFRPDLKVSTTTLKTYEEFITWCQAPGRDYSTNYIGSKIKCWKRLGQLVSDNPIFKDGEFKKLSEDTFAVYLDEKELKAIIDIELTGRQALARDWFIIGCFTGLRVSDLLLLGSRNLGKKYITIANEKTDDKVVIPIHPEVQKVFNRHGGFPRYLPDSDINEYIKAIARKAGIDNDVLYTITKGGERKDYYLKKWEMISTHTMRRSAVTNMRKQGMPNSVIKKITGIKSDRTLERYDKLTSEEAASIAAGMKFFK